MAQASLQPSVDFEIDTNSSAISLRWFQPSWESNIDEYTVKYKEVGTSQKIFETQKTEEPRIVLKNLRSGTEYEIKVFYVIDGEETRIFTKTASTIPKIVTSLIEGSTKVGRNIYRLIPVKISNLAENVRCCDMKIMTQASFQPSVDFEIDTKSSEISLRWFQPSWESNIDEYTVKYKEVGTSKKTFQIQKTEEPRIVLKNLTCGMQYEIKVFYVIDDEETRIFTKTASTIPKIDTGLKGGSTKVDRNTYRLKPVKISDLPENVRCCEMISEYTPATKYLQDEKTIMLLGATGSGKTTIIETMFNYIVGVSLRDDFRFKIIQLTEKERAKVSSQTESQTDGITCYRIPRNDAFSVNFAINIIDTPGFGDTRGKAYDNRIPKMVEHLFEHGIESIDAICIVVPLSRQRLDEREKYIFGSIMKLFGKDVDKNIFPFITFDDGGQLNALDALDRAGVPFNKKKYFKFNNSDYFDISPSEAVWVKRYENFEKFFQVLEKEAPKKSLVWSKEVLKSRENLQVQLERIEDKICKQVQLIENVKKEKELGIKYKNEIENNKNFSYHEKVPVKVKSPSLGESLICSSCEDTCHPKCWVPCSAFVYLCSSISWKGICKVCKCGSDVHEKVDFTYVVEYKEITKTKDDMLRQYNIATKKKNMNKTLFEQQKMACQDCLEELNEMLQKVKEWIQQLQKMALKPDVFELHEYIDQLIRKEKQERKCGYEDRVRMMGKMIPRIKQKSSVVGMLEELF